MTDTPRQRLGNAGENRAKQHLQAAGLRPILDNYRCRVGELDLVMADGEAVAVIEVRVRARNDYGGALASVQPRKQRRIMAATRHLLASRPDLASRALRFDVIGIDGDGRMDWIRDAFRPNAAGGW